MKYNVIERWMTYILIRGSNQAKYGTLTKVFMSQYFLGKDHYPRSITKANDSPSNHKIDPQYYENQKRNHDKSRINRETCDTENEGNTKSFAQQELICY